MNSIILRTATALGNVVDFDDIARLNATGLWHEQEDHWSLKDSGYYFFFDSELEILSTSDRKIYSRLKETQLRHCIPYKGKFFDYIVKKEYATLEEWAADNGKDVGNIYYGRADIHFRTSNPAHTEWWRKKEFIHYVTFSQLMYFLMPKGSNTQIVCEEEITCSQEAHVPTKDIIDNVLRQLEAIRISLEGLRTL